MSDQGAGNIPVTGDEHVLLQNDEGVWIGEATTQAIADLATPGGGSGLPPQWTDGGNGDVTATVDDVTKTAFELLAEELQEVAPLIITSDTELGSTDLILVRQSVGKGGADIFTVDDSGEVDLHVVDPNADGLVINENAPEPGVGDLLKVSGSMENRNQLAKFLATDIGGDVGVNAQTLFDGGMRVVLQSFGDVLIFDPVVGTTTFVAHTGQTADLARFQDDANVNVARVLPSGAIGTSSGEPADGDINPGECFRYFIPTNGAAKVGFKGKTLDGTVVKREDAIAP